jgi:DNA-binding beta-propeller fold protein YncE
MGTISRMSIRTLLAAFVAAGALSLSASAAEAPRQTSFQPAQNILLGAPSRWDYVAVAGRRAYVAHGTQVDVLSLDTRQVVGRVSGLEGAHGVAIDADHGRGFVAEGDRGKLTVFTLDTLTATASAAVGPEPDTVVYDRASDSVFVFDGENETATILDAGSLRVLATIELGGTPEFAVVDGKGALFVNIKEKREILRIDTQTRRIVTAIALGDCTDPHGLALDPARRLLFSSCANRSLAVADIEQQRVVDRVAIGLSSDAVVYDAKRDELFVSNGEGFVSVIRRGKDGRYRTVEEVRTRLTGRTMGVDPASGALLVPSVGLEIDWTKRTAKFADEGVRVLVFDRKN